MVVSCILRDSGESDYVEMLKNIIRFQNYRNTPFYLMLTFQLRDTGKEEYVRFINDTLDFIDNKGANTDEVRRFYTTSNIKDQSFHLRLMRFCVPIYLHKIAYQDFQIRSYGAWNYKNFYHTSLLFEPRTNKGILGRWPPFDEVAELLRAPLERIEEREGEVEPLELAAPELKYSDQ